MHLVKVLLLKKSVWILFTLFKFTLWNKLVFKLQVIMTVTIYKSKNETGFPNTWLDSE